MAKKTAPEPEASPAIGVEARRVLALMSSKSRKSPSAVLESAIREKAEGEQVVLPGRMAENDSEAEPEARGPISGRATIDLRPPAARAAAGDTAAREEIRRAIVELRAAAPITPAKRPDELDPDWQDRFLAQVEQLRRAVPQEWTAEELEEQIAQAIAEVRASRAGDH